MNELHISADLLEQMLGKGNEYRAERLRVIDGPDPEAKIVFVRWETGRTPGSREIVLVYDRDVPDSALLQSLIE